jgi:hypothetical protein
MTQASSPFGRTLNKIEGPLSLLIQAAIALLLLALLLKPDPSTSDAVELRVMCNALAERLESINANLYQGSVQGQFWLDNCR